MAKMYGRTVVSVSILVLMDLPFLHNIAVTLQVNPLPFQSLFLWIFRSYRIFKNYKRSSKSEVSILVLMDLPFLQSRKSLLELIITACFNPCSYGSSVLTELKNLIK